MAILAHHHERAWELSRSRTGSRASDETARLAVDYLGRWAERMFAYQARQAEDLYSRAVAIADEAGDAIDERTITRLLTARAECLIEMGRHGEAIADAARARRSAARLGDRRLVARALLAVGRAESDLGRMHRARRFEQDALELFKAERDLRGQAWTYHRLSETWSRTDYRREIDDLRRAHRLFARSRDRWGRAVVAQDLAYLLTTAGGPEFERWYEEARRLAEDEGDLRSRSSLLRSSGYVSFFRGEHAEAIRAMREARPVAALAGDRYTEVDTWIIEAMAASAIGEPSDVLALSEEILRLARELESARIRTLGLLAAATGALRMGDPPLAMRRLAAASKLARERRMAVDRAEVERVRAGILLDRAAWAGVPQAATRVRAIVRANGWKLWEPLDPLLRGRALLGGGDPRARKELARAVELAREVGATGTLLLAEALHEQARILAGERLRVRRVPDSGPEIGAVLLENRGISALASGSPDRAFRALAGAVEAWSTMGKTSWLARALALQAYSARDAGDRRAAGRLERKAVGVLDAVRTPPSNRAPLLRPLEVGGP